jgi:HSP20 family protein
MAHQSLVPKRKEQGGELTSLRRAMNSLFDDFFTGMDFMPLMTGHGEWAPRLDLAEDEKELRVSAELPGMEMKDVDVYLTDHDLTIKGEKKEEREERRKNYYRRERTYGSFHRTIPLPVEIDMEKVAASFANGVLTVTMPKTAAAQKAARKIEVKSA